MTLSRSGARFWSLSLPCNTFRSTVVIVGQQIAVAAGHARTFNPGRDPNQLPPENGGPRAGAQSRLDVDALETSV
jgi:hypothetical protein